MKPPSRLVLFETIFSKRAISRGINLDKPEQLLKKVETTQLS